MTKLASPCIAVADYPIATVAKAPHPQSAHVRFATSAQNWRNRFSIAARGGPQSCEDFLDGLRANLAKPRVEPDPPQRHRPPAPACRHPSRAVTAD